MSDEEKKAIDSITAWVDFEESTGGKLTPFRIVLNLIKKLSKEIEELKEKNKNLEDELNKYIVKMSDEEYRRLVDIIRDETSKEWKDKIKAKIEEQYDKKSKARLEMVYLYRYTIAVLQSLLPKE